MCKQFTLLKGMMDLWTVPPPIITYLAMLTKKKLVIVSLNPVWIEGPNIEKSDKSLDDTLQYLYDKCNVFLSTYTVMCVSNVIPWLTDGHVFVHKHKCCSL